MTRPAGAATPPPEPTTDRAPEHRTAGAPRDRSDPRQVPAAPVRVLWLIKGLGPGGAERLVVTHAAVGDRLGVVPRAAYLVPWKDQLVPELEALDVPVTCLDGARTFDLRWAWRLRRLLVDAPVDVVHVHSPLVAAVARLVARTLPRRRRPALLTTEHNRWPRHRWPTRLANLVTFPLDDAHLAVSTEVRSTIPAWLRGGVDVEVHGIDLAAVQAVAAERDAVRAELGVTDDEVVVGTVANLRREKGYDVLLDAAARLVDPAGIDGCPPVRVVAVGQGPLADEIAARHAELGLGARCLLLGYRPDAVRVMAGFDVFTLASRHEGLPVALMDALALGLPVVATRVGGIPEAVTDDREGLLVPPDDADALVRAWRALADDPERRTRLGAAATTGADRFDARVAVARLEARYRRLAASRRS